MNGSVFGLRMIPRLILWFAAALLPVACVHPTPTPSSEPIKLRVVASPGLKPLAQELASAFATRAPYIVVSVWEMRADAARKAVTAGDADLALVRGWMELETTAELKAETIGREAVVIAVHPDNPVRSLTWQQLRAIFSGDIWDWRAIDPRWEPQEILVVVQLGNVTARRVFEGRVMEGVPVTRRAVIAPGGAAARELIASDPAAIGYLAASFVDTSVRALTVEGVSPTPEAVASQAWPLSQPLWLLYGEDASVYVLDFVDFARGAKGQAIVGRRYGRLRSTSHSSFRTPR